MQDWSKHPVSSGLYPTGGKFNIGPHSEWQKPTSSLITLPLKEPPVFSVKYRWQTRTTTLLRLSCSCYLLVKSVQAWWISTTVSCWKRQALFHLSALTEQGGDLWRGLTADDGLLGELNPLLFSPLISGSISATCHAFILWVVRGNTKATCTAGGSHTD